MRVAVRLFLTALSAFLTLVLASVVVGSQAPAPTHATVIRNVNLRNDSSDDLPPIRLLKPPTILELVQSESEDGYFKVRTAEHQEGWVWGRNIRIEGAALVSPMTVTVSEFLATWDKPAPNKSSFTGPSGHCGFGGLGEEVDANQRKNRTDIPRSYHDVSFTALASLEYPDAPKHRSDWSDEQLAVIAPFEGVPIRVVGFLVAVKPQTGSQEATNCRFTKAVETDWHMALVEQAGQGEKDAVVVETTPRIRRSHPKWMPTALKPWTDIPRFRAPEPSEEISVDALGDSSDTKIEVFKDGKWMGLDQ